MACLEVSVRGVQEPMDTASQGSHDQRTCASAESAYEIIDGSIYNQELLQQAQAAAAVAPEGILDLQSAKGLWATVVEESDTALQDVSLETISYIAQLYKLDVMAKTFLRESVKLAREIAKKKARLEAKTPSDRSSTAASSSTTPKKSKPKLNAFLEIQRIEQEIAEAKSLTQMKRAQTELNRWKAMMTAETETAAKPTKRPKCMIRIIDGKKHDDDLIKHAENVVRKGNGEGTISLRVAKQLWSRAQFGDGLIAPPQRRALEYIVVEFDVSENAQELLDEKLCVSTPASRKRAAPSDNKDGSPSKSQKPTKKKGSAVRDKHLNSALSSFSGTCKRPRYRMHGKRPAPRWVEQARRLRDCNMTAMRRRHAR